MAVCDRCNGSGVHDHPAFSNGLRREELEDDDFMEDYRNGCHDVRCSVCNGLRVIAIPDEALFTPQQKALWDEHCEARRDAFYVRQMRDRGIQY